MSKVNCTNPAHVDQTPSMEIYEDAGYCFSCGFMDKSLADTKPGRKEPTDIPKMLKYIRSLPLIKTRGLYFHADDIGFYIEWPNDGLYYKKRLFEGKARYINPRGSTPPLYIHQQCPHDLVVIEGEINARSLYAAGCTTASICSPGSANTFDKYTHVLTEYRKIAIVVDKDKPGVIAGLKLKKELLKHRKKVQLVAVEKDFSEVYEKEGSEALSKYYKKEVGL